MKHLRTLIVLILLVLSSCGIAPPAPTLPPVSLITADPNLPATPTPFQPVVATLPPLVSPTFTLVASFTPEPPTNTPPPTFAFTATSLPIPTQSSATRTQYSLYALLDYYGHQLAVDETITYTNQTGVTLNELVMAVEPNKKFGVKTFAAPPASDVTNTYLLDSDGGGTKLTLQMDAVLTPPGMPNMPGMEDMMKKQMITGLETSLNLYKKLIEG